MTNRTLKVAEPTMVPMPTSDSWNVPMSDVNSSGADPPAAMRVAPATSIDRFRRRSDAISSRAGTKNSSHTMANARNIYITPMMYQSSHHVGSAVFMSEQSFVRRRWRFLAAVVGGGTSCAANWFALPSSAERRRATDVAVAAASEESSGSTGSWILSSSPTSPGSCDLSDIVASDDLLLPPCRPSASLTEESLARTLPTLPVDCIGATAHLGCCACCRRIPPPPPAPCSEPNPPLSVATLKTSTNPTNPTNVIDRKTALIRCFFEGRYVAAGERRRAHSPSSGSSRPRPSSIPRGGAPSAACRGAIVALGLPPLLCVVLILRSDVRCLSVAAAEMH